MTVESAISLNIRRPEAGRVRQAVTTPHGAAVGAFVAVLLMALLPGSPLQPRGGERETAVAGDASREVEARSIGSEWAVANDDDLLLFIADWERSLTGRFTLSAGLARTPLSPHQSTFGSAHDPATAEPSMITLVHHAQLDHDHRIHQIGGVATVVDPVHGVRSCRRIENEFWCSPAPAGNHPDRGLRATLDTVSRSVSGDTADHRLYRLVDFESSDLASIAGIDRLVEIAPELRCWDARALTGDQGHPWGRRSQFCFDNATGALVLNRTFGQYRIETMMAFELSSDVSSDDLDPQSTNIGP
jgi:hypothetical protein